MKTLFLSFIFLIPGLSYAKSARPSLAAVPEQQVQPKDPNNPKDTPGFCIFGAQSGKPFDSAAAFKTVVWKSDVVYVGETHDQLQDHLAQLEALQAMREARGSKIVVGFEMLDTTLQPVLDDYAAGSINEQEFLVKTDWPNEWGFDFDLYKPLFDFIRENKLKALALNVPKKIISKIASGGLEALSSEDKQYLPEKIEITKHKKYTDYIKKSFAAHGDDPMTKTLKFENYLASICACNEGMGSRLADFMIRNPEYSALAIVWNGHVMYNAAIPASVKARAGKLRQASFYTEDAALCPDKMPAEAKNIANYVWYIAHPKKAKPAAVQSSTTTFRNTPAPTAP